MFAMDMESCTLLKNSVTLVRNISMTIDSGKEFGMEIFLSGHGATVVLMVNQPGKLMALALCLKGASKFDNFEWNEDGYRRIFLELHEFISIFELGSSAVESLSVFACPDDPEDKVRFLFIPGYSPHVRIVDFDAIRESEDPPQVDESSGTTLTMKSFCFQYILDFFDVIEVDEGVRDLLWIEIFPDFVRFNVGDKEFDLAQEEDQYLSSSVEIGKVLTIYLGYASSFYEAIELSEEVSIIASDDHTLLKFSTTEKGADIIFFIEGLPMNM